MSDEEYNLQPLLTFCEENFECQDGELRAWMEFPRPNLRREPKGPDDMVRVIYVVYAVIAKDFEPAMAWMVDNVLMPLSLRGGKYLYWRKKFHIDVLNGGEFEGRLKLRVRLGVLDKNWKPVKIEEFLNPEGGPYLHVDSRLDKGGLLWPDRWDSEEVKELKDKLWNAITREPWRDPKFEVLEDAFMEGKDGA